MGAFIVLLATCIAGCAKSCEDLEVHPAHQEDIERLERRIMTLEIEIERLRTGCRCAELDAGAGP